MELDSHDDPSSTIHRHSPEQVTRLELHPNCKNEVITAIPHWIAVGMK